MQSRALKTLVTISRIGAFNETADQLGMTHTAVSMQMKSLEAHLGVSLFDRNFRPPRLTPLGKLIAIKSSELIEVEDQILALCRDTEELIGRFRFGFVPSASVRLLPYFLNQARTQAPEAEFDIEIGVSEALTDQVVSGSMDAAVVTGAMTLNPELKALTLREESFVFAVPGQTATLDDVGDMPFLQFTPSVGIGKIIANHLARKRRRALKNKIVLNSVEAIMQCVNQGIGYTLLPLPDVETYANIDRVSVVQPAQKLERRLELIYLPDRLQSDKIDLIVSLFSDSGASSEAD